VLSRSLYEEIKGRRKERGKKKEEKGESIRKRSKFEAAKELTEVEVDSRH
jgi:hypothetical protein